MAAARAGEGTALFELLLRTPSHADGVGASAQWDNASKEVRKIPVTKLMNISGTILLLLALGILIKLARAGVSLTSKVKS